MTFRDQEYDWMGLQPNGATLTGVDSIGQAFADEGFRVFAEKHPETELAPVKANSAVKRMIARPRSTKTAPAQKDRGH
jgi:hypothetical protein